HNTDAEHEEKKSEREKKGVFCHFWQFSKPKNSPRGLHPRTPNSSPKRAKFAPLLPYFSALSLVVGSGATGRPGSKKILLHQSIDLNELYSMVLSVLIFS
ncbi:hypothetical protein OAO87_04390, partial [bacterium]|nr:hypothetical protein [bacterium]